MKSLHTQIESRLEQISPSVEEVLSFCSSVGFSDDALFNIDIPLREALANAIEHGNRGDAGKRVDLTVSELEDGVKIVIRDFGDGFDPDAVADPTDPQNLLSTSGRGLLFMRTLLDSVKWESHPEGGTVVTMLKKRV
jgi:serine/threonine-protein kinase RsbW